MSNCVARMQNSMNCLVGDEIDVFSNHSLLKYTRPFDRGYLVNWQTEIDVWNRIFDADHLNISPMNHSLVVTEPFLNPLVFQNEMNEVIFEDYMFESCCRRPAVSFAEYYFREYLQQNHDNRITTAHHGCMLVIDSGFSFTHVIPLINHKVVKNLSVRIDLGGKLLTNYLKEIISFRQMNVMDDFNLINQLKEDMCVVNNDNITKFPDRSGDSFYGQKVFVLPDFQRTFRGAILDHDKIDDCSQFLKMNSKYIKVPTMLFYPTNIEMNQQGIIEAASNCIQSFPSEEASLICENVLLIGGNARFRNFKEKIQFELRKQVENLGLVDVSDFKSDSIVASWKGASIFAEQAMDDIDMKSRHFITRSEYEECGHYHCNKKFQQNW